MSRKSNAKVRALNAVGPAVWNGKEPAMLDERRHFVYPDGTPVVYGYWNDMTKRFVRGVQSRNPHTVFRKAVGAIGDSAYRWRYEVRAIPQGMLQKKETESA